MNYGQLKAAMTAYTHRSDAAAMADSFLPIAEQRIYFGESNSPAIRVSSMLSTVTMADGTRPAGFLEAKKVFEQDRPWMPLEFRPMEFMNHECRAFSWDGETMVLSRDMAFPMQLTYYGQFSTPALDTDTNPILTKFPNVYLTSMLVEFARWARDDEMLVREAGNYASAVSSAQSADQRAQHSGSMLVMRKRP